MVAISCCICVSSVVVAFKALLSNPLVPPTSFNSCSSCASNNSVKSFSIEFLVFTSAKDSTLDSSCTLSFACFSSVDLDTACCILKLNGVTECMLFEFPLSSIVASFMKDLSPFIADFSDIITNGLVSPVCLVTRSSIFFITSAFC